MTELPDQKRLRRLLCASYDEFKDAVKRTYKNELHLFWETNPYVITIEQVGSFWWIRVTETGIETHVLVLEIMLKAPCETIHYSNMFELTPAVIREGVKSIVRYWKEEGLDRDRV